SQSARPAAASSDRTTTPTRSASTRSCACATNSAPATARHSTSARSTTPSCSSRTPSRRSSASCWGVSALDVLTGSISTYVFTMLHGRPAFLLLFRAPHLPHANTWQAVHGMIDPGEKAYEAAYRETVEETGLIPDRFFKTDYVETFYSDLTDAVHMV